jgi:PAS domain S-box-containing protein
VSDDARETASSTSFVGFLGRTKHALGVLDGQGRLLSLNPAAEMLLAHASRGGVGTEFWNAPRFSAQDDPREQLQTAIFCAREGECTTVCAKLDHDGTRIHVDFTFSPFRNDEENITGVVFEGIDVTDRVEAQEALAESELRYRSIFDTNPAVKLVIDPNTGRIVDANASALRFYGYSLEALCQLRIQEINTLPEAEIRREMEHARTEQRLFFNFKHRTHGGEIRDVEVYSGPMELSGRQLLHSIIIDVTDRRRLEERLARTQRMEAIGQLAGGVAHDFNNILTVVLGYVDLAMRSLPVGAPAAAHIREIGEAARQASDLTQELLSLARKNIAPTRAVDVGELVLQTDRFLRRLIGENVELVAVIEPDLPPVEVNAGRFQQALVNLVINARDAIVDRGRIRISVEHASDVVLARDRPCGAVRILVSDTGTGISDDDLPRIFDPLFTTKESQGGTGFGLATCKNFVEAAGGRVSVETELGVGTTFTLLLPACDPVEPAARRAAGHIERQVSGSVLLAEDEPSVRRLVASSMRRAGYVVVEAENGDVALRLFEAAPTRFDLLVTDVVMPLLGGPELSRRVATLRPELPVLFVSGYPADLDPRVLESDRVGFLPKPFTASALLDAVDGLLGDNGRANPG